MYLLQISGFKQLYLTVKRHGEKSPMVVNMTVAYQVRWNDNVKRGTGLR